MELSSSVDKGHYQRLVGKLIYLSHTCPDIAFVVSMVSQFTHSPTEECFEAVYQVMKYLKESPGKGLLLEKRGICRLRYILMLIRQEITRIED